MKKVIFIVLAVFVMTISLAGCGQKTSDNDDGKLSVVTTIFPEYDWVNKIIGEKANNADVTMLLDNGVDLHSYQPSAEDIIKISNCDVFIYVGGESDEWVEDALEKAENSSMQTVNLLETIGKSAKEEETVEGMEEEDEEEEDEEEESDDPEYDEHVWLSLRNAQICCSAICDALAEADKENAEVYRSNADKYAKSLDSLDKKYEKAVKKAKNRTLLFGDRFPFRYMADDYGLKYYAAFSGCSAESEASFETITFLAKKVNQLKLPAVLTLEGSDQKIAKAVVDASKSRNVKILSMDSMQSTTSEDVSKGASYMSSMEKNLKVLKKALKKKK